MYKLYKENRINRRIEILKFILNFVKILYHIIYKILTIDISKIRRFEYKKP